MSKKTVIDRVEELEKSFPSLVQAVNEQFMTRLTPIVQTINALTDMVGREAVAAKVVEMRQLQQTEDSNKEKAQVEKMVEEGKLVKAEKISKDSLVVGKETNLNGEVVHPGRFQVGYAQVAPAFQEKLLGNGVGTKFDVPNVGTFEVTEVYDVVQVPETNKELN